MTNSHKQSAEEVLKNDGFLTLLNHLFLEITKEKSEEKRFNIHRDEWDTILKGLESFAKQEVKRACKHQRYLCADEIKYDPEVESTIIDDFKDSVLNAQEPKI